jgi:hypothetical protein
MRRGANKDGLLQSESLIKPHLMPADEALFKKYKNSQLFLNLISSSPCLSKKLIHRVGTISILKNKEKYKINSVF